LKGRFGGGGEKRKGLTCEQGGGTVGKTYYENNTRGGERIVPVLLP